MTEWLVGKVEASANVVDSFKGGAELQNAVGCCWLQMQLSAT